MADNPNMKKNDLSKRRCRYRIGLEGQTEEQMDKPKKKTPILLIQISSVEVQIQLTQKSSDNLEIGTYVFYSFTVYFKENYCFPRFQRDSIFFQGG